MNTEKTIKIHQKWGFGMAPLKKETSLKNLKAVKTIHNLLMNKDYSLDGVVDDISLFKGLINRIIRQDQWDWFTIYTKFGEPNPLSLKKIPNQLTLLRKAISNNNLELNKILRTLSKYKVVNLCESYLEISESKHQDKETGGYIYILSQRDAPKILKIGMTKRKVSVRVKEINSTTGVLIPFSPRRIYKVKDPTIAEKEIFKLLSQFRIRKDREFFNLDFKVAEKEIEKFLLKKGYIYN